tara:strand:- start:91 stop:747 length:657 start_codon:yes stop_codon:yes gene_type:complete
MSINYINNYKAIIKNIKRYEKIFNKNINLIVVSKTQSYQKIIDLKKIGQIDFGENYLDEAQDKINQIKDSSIRWHYIGKIQSNKIRAICKDFEWIHTLSSQKHAIRINNECKEHKKIMNVCIQINIDEEDSKGGILLSEYDSLSSSLIEMSNIRLRGIMTIPQADKSPLESFSKMRDLYNRYDNLDTLSMGMSKDYLTAIENHANMIRIGQQIFGKRT